MDLDDLPEKEEEEEGKEGEEEKCFEMINKRRARLREVCRILLNELYNPPHRDLEFDEWIFSIPTEGEMTPLQSVICSVWRGFRNTW